MLVKSFAWYHYSKMRQRGQIPYCYYIYYIRSPRSVIQSKYTIFI